MDNNIINIHNFATSSLTQDIAYFNSKKCSTDLAQRKSSQGHTREDIYGFCKKYGITRYRTRKNETGQLDQNINIKSRLKSLDDLCYDIRKKLDELQNSSTDKISKPLQTSSIKEISSEMINSNSNSRTFGESSKIINSSKSHVFVLKKESPEHQGSFIRESPLKNQPRDTYNFHEDSIETNITLQKAGASTLTARQKVIHGFILGDILANDTLANSSLLYNRSTFNNRSFDIYSYKWLIVSLKKGFNLDNFPTDVLPSVLLYVFLIQSFSESSEDSEDSEFLNDIRTRYVQLLKSYQQDPSLIFLNNKAYAKEIITTDVGSEIIMPVLYAITELMIHTSVPPNQMSSTDLLLWINDLDIPNSAVTPIIFSIWAIITRNFEQDENYKSLAKQISRVARKIL